MKTLRFWMWENGGWIRFGLKDGERLRWHRHYTHEEGWSSEGWQLWRVGGTLRIQTWSDGRDCDGRLSSCDEYIAEELEEFSSDCKEFVMRPKWIALSSYQRDYTAEAAGY